MRPEPDIRPGDRIRFRRRLLAAMMAVVVPITALGLYVGQRKLTDQVAGELQARFQTELGALHTLQEVRHAALAERCRALVRKPRIHAALEDNALDLLYPSARDELQDLLVPVETSVPAFALHAEFYRFLDVKGAVIPSNERAGVGKLEASEETRLALHVVPREPQTGYLWRSGATGRPTLSEIVTVPITSTETGEGIAALVLGFKPSEPRPAEGTNTLRGGILVDGTLHLPGLGDSDRILLAGRVDEAVRRDGPGEGNFRVQLNGVPHLLFHTRINPGSAYPAAYEVCLFPLTHLATRQRQLLLEVVGSGMVILLVGLAASQYLSTRLSVPVEKLAVDSELNLARRQQAETELKHTHVELQRSIRFSADASHQLKTPVAVLRAGLEELLDLEGPSPEVREELSALVHQTSRLTGMIEDLLLLSRMDEGRLQLELVPVDLSLLIAGELDDLGAQPDPFELQINAEVPPGLLVAGERRYTALILRNLLENARKYNRTGGRIRVVAGRDGETVSVRISNTGRPIPSEAHDHIFERFHRGSAGENVPGHGLGLNLARELAHLHGGMLSLIRSHDDLTEFSVRFRCANLPKQSLLVES